MGGCTDEQIVGSKTVHVGDNVTLTCARKGTEPDVTTVPTPDPVHTEASGCLLRVEVPTSDAVHPGDSETLRCSVLSDSEKKTCPGDHSVYCFRAESHEFHLTLLYAHGQDGDICEKTLEAQLTQKCVYNFSKSISFSDAGTHYCAVVMCGEILFGNGTKLDVEAANMWDSQRANTMFFLLCVVLTISLIIIAFVICSIKSWDCCSGTQTTGGQHNQHFRNLRRDEDAWVYSAVVYTMMEGGSGGMMDAKAAEREGIYDAVRAFGLDQPFSQFQQKK
ncbi:uncharacterized protein LOC130173972 [Seriola aureovittata]|uniref:uncharacterized protein LOC130173972 n=1 Tax=Seriola aureovittata TaxID=2871759 RepID=UPI0024BE76B8|nr:uncharacterized protein LOC130173972 [Seriola aureovittata]